MRRRRRRRRGRGRGYVSAVGGALDAGGDGARKARERARKPP